MKDDLRLAPEVAERWLLGVLGSVTTVIVVLFTTVMMWTLVVSSGAPVPWLWWGSLPLIASAAVGLLVTAELLCLRHRLLAPQHPLVRSGSPRLRTVTVVAVAAAATVLAPWNPLGAISLGAVAGAECAIRRAGRLGSSAPTEKLERRLRMGLGAVMLLVVTLVVSLAYTLVVPVVVALLGSGEMGTGDVVHMQLATKSFLALLLAGITACGVYGGLGRVSRKLAQEVAGYFFGIRQRYLRHRAQWMHDHLLSEISFMMLEFQARPVGSQWAVERLRDLDHRLRVEQITDLIESGPTRIASLVQVHVRRSMNLGVKVSPVPEFQQVDVVVDSDTGRLINRVLSTLFSNAMNAGAKEIGLDVRVDSTGVEISVSDDAGGFDLRTIPVGRGLEELISELGRSGVSREALPGGSMMRVMVPYRLLLEVAGSEPAAGAGCGVRKASR